MQAIERLCALDRPFLLDAERERLFEEAMDEALRHHLASCPEFARFARTCSDERWPYLLVDIFKRYELLSVPREEIVLHVTSSGTSGQKSQTFMDRTTLDRAQAMLAALFEEFGLTDPERVHHYLLMAYDPAEAPDLGSAFTSTNWTRFTRKGDIFYALGRDGFNEEGSVRFLEAHQGAEPVRIVGFPAFLHRMLLNMKPVSLPKGSLVLTGGGYKTATGLLDKSELLDLVVARLGIPAESVRDNFGMVEHGAPYVECPAHAFHVPVFCRALVRDPVTMKPLPHGELGLLQLMTPFSRAVPNLSLLTTDLAVLTKGCPCGRQAPVITILGRGGVRKHAGCAITASAILQ